MNYTSNELYHLVGRTHPLDHEHNYGILLKIIDDYCITHPPHNPRLIEHRITLNLDKDIFSGELVSPTMTCFCDIPFESLSIHIRKYGSFGIAFPRDFLISNGARPVNYVPMQPSDWRGTWGTAYGAGLLNDWEQVWRGSQEYLIKPLGHGTRMRNLGKMPESSEEASVALDEIVTQHLAFTKPFDSELSMDDPNNYYMEREWRKIANLPFTLSDIAMVLVHETFHDRILLDRPLFAEKIRAAPV